MSCVHYDYAAGERFNLLLEKGVFRVFALTGGWARSPIWPLGRNFENKN